MRRVAGGVLSALVLILAVGRCSPLASSMSKYAIGSPSQSEPTMTSTGRGFDFKTYVVAPAELESKSLDSATIEVSDIEGFKKTGKAEVISEDPIDTDQAEKYFVVGDVDVAKKLNNSFKASLVHNGGDSYTLSVVKKGPLDEKVVEEVKQNLKAAVISVPLAGDPVETVTPPAEACTQKPKKDTKSLD